MDAHLGISKVLTTKQLKYLKDLTRKCRTSSVSSLNLKLRLKSGKVPLENVFISVKGACKKTYQDYSHFRSDTVCCLTIMILLVFV